MALDFMALAFMALAFAALGFGGLWALWARGFGFRIPSWVYRGCEGLRLKTCRLQGALTLPCLLHGRLHWQGHGDPKSGMGRWGV